MVENRQEWEVSRKKLKERKKLRTKEDRTSDQPTEYGFPIGDFKEQIGRLLDTARGNTQERR